MEIELTKISSKGQIVIPKSIREKMKLMEGETISVMGKDDMIILKKVEIPKIKTWNDVAKPFRNVVKKSGITREDLDNIIFEVRSAKK